MQNKIILRKIEENDFNFLYELLLDPSITKTFIVQRDYKNAYEFKSLFEILKNKSEKAVPLTAIIEVVDEKIPIGIMALPVFDEYSAEIGYAIAPKYWNKGYATAAIAAEVAYLFKNTAIDSILASFFEGNESSQRVLIKNGFKYRNTFQNEVFYQNKQQSLIYYQLKREDYYG